MSSRIKLIVSGFIWKRKLVEEKYREKEREKGRGAKAKRKRQDGGLVGRGIADYWGPKTKMT